MSYIISYASKKSEICIQIVKGIQLAKRTGIIKSRVIGARVASEQILGLAYFQKSLTPSFCLCLKFKCIRRLRKAKNGRFWVMEYARKVFLDSHIECTKDWLYPLLRHVIENPKTISMPVISSVIFYAFYHFLDPWFNRLRKFSIQACPDKSDGWFWLGSEFCLVRDTVRRGLSKWPQTWNRSDPYTNRTAGCFRSTPIIFLENWIFRSWNGNMGCRKYRNIFQESR